jgi:predicted RNA binding protein YcfA (HicA-like mRNA interferase family)
VIPLLPRGLSGRQLMRLAEKVGYRYDRASGSHVVCVRESDGQQHICIPDHKELSVGTMNDIIRDMAQQLQLPKAQLMQLLFG